MTAAQKEVHDPFREEQEFWDTYVLVNRQRGIDPNQLLLELAKAEVQRLNSLTGQADFTELCEHGCIPQVLGAILALLRFSPRAERAWWKIAGPPSTRDRAARTLEKAASTFEELFGPAVEDPTLEKALSSTGPISPWRMAHVLRMYGRVLKFLERIAADTHTRSVKDLSKYVLTGYVKRATGRFRDRNVACLIEEILRPAPHDQIVHRASYDEVAHRMWRSRNYKRLETHFSGPVNFLFAMGVVIARHKT